MDVAVSLGVAAGLIYAVGYGLYFRKILAGGVRPNLASWLLWTVLTVLNCLSYLALSGDAVKATIPVVSSFACAGIFLFALRRGRFGGLDAADALALAVGAAATVVWWRYRSAAAANLLMQGCLLVSFIPTWRGVIRDPRAEPSAPWIAWASGYIFAFAVVFLRWRGQPLDLVYPSNCLVLHGGVALLTLRRVPTAP